MKLKITDFVEFHTVNWGRKFINQIFCLSDWKSIDSYRKRSNKEIPIELFKHL